MNQQSDDLKRLAEARGDSSMTSMEEQELDILLLEARSDEYGDSGNYNEAKLKRLISQHTQRAYQKGVTDTATSPETLKLMDDIRVEAYDLLYWKYKELNGQSVDVKFAEAYGILKNESVAQLSTKDSTNKEEA